MGRRRLGQLAAVLVLGCGALAFEAAPAHAATTLDVTAGYAGGSFLPGRAARVRVAVAADRLLKGVVEVRFSFGPSVVVTRPIEVPGGSTKELVVALPTFTTNFGGGPSLRVEVSVSDGGGVVADDTASLEQTSGAELVGVLPGARAAATVPETAALTVDAGTARFASVDELDLAEPGAVDALDQLALAPGELGALGADARRNVLAWLGEGGRLVLVGTPGEAVAGLPDAWQPRAARRIAADAGEVTWAPGAAATWYRSLEPTPTRSVVEDGIGKPWMTVPVAAVLAQDAGVRSARVGWLVGFLVAYVVLAGPGAYLVLRRLGRPMLLWAVVPGLAVVFTAGGWLAGRSLRGGAEAAHTTIVETRPSGARATTWVGVAARAGGTVDVAFPEGWTPVASSSQFAFGSGPGTTRFASDGRRPTGRLELAAGGFALTAAMGDVPFEGGLEIIASSSEDGTVDGTVRNTTPYPLGPVRAFAGNASVDVGTLAPGESSTFRITDASAPFVMNGPLADAWDTFDPFTGRLRDATGVNSGAWDELLSNRGGIANGPRVVVAGWTRGVAPPVTVRGKAPVGRTAVVAGAPVSVAGNGPTDRSIERSVLRGVGGFNAPPSGNAIVSFTLPPGVDPAATALRTGSGVTAASVWLGGAWTPVTVRDGRGSLPAAAFTDGRAFVRVDVTVDGPFPNVDVFLTAAGQR